MIDIDYGIIFIIDRRIMQSENNSDLPSFTASNQQDDENFSIDSDATQRFLQEHGDLAKIITLLSYNQGYVELMDRLIVRVDKAIEQNRSLQAQVRAKIANPFPNATKHQKRELVKIPCWPPYFKDSNGMAPNLNTEALEIDRICLVNPLVEEERRWNQRECEQLRSAVCNSLKEQQILSLDPRKELYLNKLHSAGIETTDEQKAIWRDNVERINRKAAYIRQIAMDEFLRENRDYSQVDWAKIWAIDLQGTRSIPQLRQKWCNEMAYNTNEFTLEEDEMILELAKEHSNWDTIAEKLSTDRSAFHCFQRFIYLEQTQKEATPWSPDEDQKLLRLISLTKIGEEIPWGKIAMYITGRSKLACEYRYTRSLCEKLRHGRWTEGEDLRLLEAINKYGPQNWTKIAESVKGRSALQCRDRWIHVLDYKRRDLPWTWEEHQRLLYGVRLFGRDECAKIAKLIPGRNNMDVRLRIRLLIKYQIEQQEKQNGKVVFRHFANNYHYCKMRRKTVLEDFSKYLERKKEDRRNLLVSRLGLGSFVAKPSGVDLDYTKVIKKRTEEFNDWKILGSGRWVKINHKNPNEYDREDLMNELNKLSNEEREETLNWLAESDRRLEAEKEQEKEIPDNTYQAKEYYDQMFPEERLANLSQQIMELLPPTENDRFNYNQYKKRPPKIRIKKMSKPKKEKKKRIQQKRKRIKKTKLVKILENFDKLDENQVQALRWSDRLMVEVLKKVENMSEEERRLHLMLKLCYVVRQRVHFTAMYKYKKDFESREMILQPMFEYVKQIVDDLPAPIPVMMQPDPKFKEETNPFPEPEPSHLQNAVILPNNWQSMSMRELAKLKISPELYKTLAMKAQTTAQFPQQDEPPTIGSRVRKRRKSSDLSSTAMEGFKNTIIMPMDIESCNPIEIKPFASKPNAKKNKRLRQEKPQLPQSALSLQPEPLSKISNKLLPPCLSTLDAVELFQNRVRSRLKKGIDLHRYLKYLANNEDNDGGDLGDEAPGSSNSIRNQQTTKFEVKEVGEYCTLVPDKMRTTPEYALLKKRMYRLFFLPMAMVNLIGGIKEKEKEADDPDKMVKRKSYCQKMIEVKQEGK